MSPLPVRALPDVGFKLEQQLKGMEVQLVQDLRRFTLQQLTAQLGERAGE